MSTSTVLDANQHNCRPTIIHPEVCASDLILATIVAQHLELNLTEEWDSMNLSTILTKLLEHNISKDLITECRLRELMNLVHKKAMRNVDKTTMILSAKLMEKWEKLFKEDCPCTTSKKPSPPVLRLTTAKESTKLRHTDNKIYFELSNKPTFFSRTTSSKPLFTYRQQPVDITTLLDQLEQHVSPTRISTPRRPSSTDRLKPIPHVKFKPDDQPVSIRKRLDDISGERSSRSILRHQNQAEQKQPFSRQLSWYPPRRIRIPDSCRRPCQKKWERPIQVAKHIPTSLPSPPIIHDGFFLETKTKFIPLFEIDTACSNHSAAPNSPPIQ